MILVRIPGSNPALAESILASNQRRGTGAFQSVIGAIVGFEIASAAIWLRRRTKK